MAPSNQTTAGPTYISSRGGFIKTAPSGKTYPTYISAKGSSIQAASSVIGKSVNINDYIFSNKGDDTIWGKVYNFITSPLHDPKYAPYFERQGIDTSKEDWWVSDDYYNPKEINSLKDWLMLAAATLTSKSIRNNGLTPLETFKAGSSEFFARTIAEPLRYKNYLQLFMNNLNSFGETIDFFEFANLNKALFNIGRANRRYLSAGERSDLNSSKQANAWERIKLSHFAIDESGTFRSYTYDADPQFDRDPSKTTTGEVIAQIALELISSPVDVLTAVSGLSAVTEGTVGAAKVLNESMAIDEFTKAAQKIIPEKAVDFALTNNESRKIIKALLYDSSDSAVNLYRSFLLGKTAKYDALTAFAYNIIKKDKGVDVFEIYASAAIKELLDASSAKINSDIVRSLASFRAGLKSYDDIVTAIAGVPIFTPTVLLAKGLFSKTGLFSKAKGFISRTFKTSTVTDPRSGQKVVNVLDLDTIIRNAEYHSEVQRKATTLTNTNPFITDNIIEDFISREGYEDMVAGPINHTLQLQVLELRDALLEAYTIEGGEQLEAVYKNVQDLIKTWTGGKAETIFEYVDLIDKTYGIDTLEKDIDGNVIRNLKNKIKITLDDDALEAMHRLIELEQDIVDEASKTPYKRIINFFKEDNVEDTLSELHDVFKKSKGLSGEDLTTFITDEYLYSKYYDQANDIVNAFKGFDGIDWDDPEVFKREMLRKLERAETISKAITDELGDYFTYYGKSIGEQYFDLIKAQVDLETAWYNAGDVNHLFEVFKNKYYRFNESYNYIYNIAIESADKAKCVSDVYKLMNNLLGPKEFCNPIITRLQHSKPFNKVLGLSGDLPSNIPYAKFSDPVKAFEDFMNTEASEYFGSLGLGYEFDMFSYDFRHCSTIADEQKCLREFKEYIDSFLQEFQELRQEYRGHTSAAIRHAGRTGSKSTGDAMLDRYNALIQDFRNLSNILERCDKTMYQVQWTNETLVSIRVEKASQAYSMVMDPSLSELYSLLDPTNIHGQVFKQILEDSSQTSTQAALLDIYERLRYMKYIKDFYIESARMLGNDDYWTAFTEAFHGFGNATCSEMLQEKQIDRLIKNMQMNLGQAYGVSPQALGFWRGEIKRNKELAEEFMDMFNDTDGSLFKAAFSDAHEDPGLDTYITEFVFKKINDDVPDAAYQFKDIFDAYISENPGRNVAIIDIETLEKTFKEVSIGNKFTDYPSQMCIKLMYGDNTVPVIFRISEDIKSGTVPKGSSVSQIIECKDLKEMLQKFMDFLEQNNVDYIGGQNVKEFDFDFIKQAWYDEMRSLDPETKRVNTPASYLEKLIESKRIFDTVDMQRAAQGIPIISEALANKIRVLVKQYASDCIKFGKINFLQIEPSTFANSLKKFGDLDLKYLNGAGDNLQVIFSEAATKYKESLAAIARIRSETDYKNVAGSVFIENIFKEHFDPVNFDRYLKTLVPTIEELGPEAYALEVQKIIKNCADDTGLDPKLIRKYIFGNANTLNASEREALSYVLDDWFHNHFAYEVLKTSDESYDDFIKLLNGNGPIRRNISLLQAGRGVGDLDSIAYKNLIDKSKFEYYSFFNLNKLSEYPELRLLQRIQNEQQALLSVMRRIRDIKAIYTLGVFHDYDELVEEVARLQKELSAHGNDWVSYIDLKNIKSEPQLFAVWYRFTQIRSNAEYLAKIYSKDDLIYTTPEMIAETKASVFNKVSRNVFLTKAYDDLEEFAIDALPLESVLDTEAWGAYNAVQRNARYLSSLDYIPGAGSKEFATRAIMSKMLAFAEEVSSGKPIKSGTYTVPSRSYYNMFTRYVKENIQTMFSLHIINKFLDKDIDYVLSRLVFDDLFYNIDTSLLKRTKRTEAEKLLIDGARELLKYADEFEKYGIIIQESATSIRIDLAADSVIQYFKDDPTKAVINGRTIFKNPEQLKLRVPKLPLDDPDFELRFIREQDIDLINELLDYCGERSSYIGIGRPVLQSNVANVFKYAGTSYLEKPVYTADQRILSGFFNDELRFNTTNLLGMVTGGYDSTTAIPQMFSAMKYIANTETEFGLFTDIFFNPANEMAPEKFFKGISLDDAYKFAKTNDNVIFARLIDAPNTKQKFRIEQIDVSSKRQMRWILDPKNRVMMLPYQVYSSAFEAINTTLDSHALPRIYNFWHNFIVHSFKIPYLVSMGTWARNVIDSNLKAAIDTGDPIGMYRNTIKAMEDYKNYNETIKLMHKWVDSGDVVVLQNTAGFTKFFREYKGKLPMTLDEFLRVQGFIVNGPSAGSTWASKQWVRASLKKNTEDTDKSFLTEVRNTRAVIDEYLLMPMSFIESRVRYAEYLTWLEHGVTKTQAFQEVSHTAFNYSLKTDGAAFLENIIPFYNFQKLNLIYWTDLLSKNPWLVHAMAEFTQGTYDSFEADPEEYRHNLSIQYHMENGNLKISDDGLVLKLNPSYMDAINFLMEPYKAIMGVSEALETGSPLLGFRQYAKNSNILSSILAPIQVSIEYTLDQLAKDESLQHVPFGKYKGKSVEYLLDDRTYVQHLLDSDFVGKIKEYYPSVYQTMIDSLNNTPRIIDFGKFKDDPQPASVLLEPENRAYAQLLLGSELNALSTEYPEHWLSTYYKPIYDMLIANGLNENPVMPWGKYEGVPISEVPKSYKDQLLNATDKNGIYWLETQWPYLYAIFTGERDTVLPKESIVTEPVMSTAEMTGMLYYQALEHPEEADSKITWENIFKNILDKKELPWWNTISAKKQTVDNLEDRLQGSEARKAAIKHFPGVFSALAQYESYAATESYSDTSTSFYHTPSTNAQVTYQSLLSPDSHLMQHKEALDKAAATRTYNYYKTRPVLYNNRNRKAYNKYKKQSLDVAGLRLGIANLRLL